MNPIILLSLSLLLFSSCTFNDWSSWSWWSHASVIQNTVWENISKNRESPVVNTVTTKDTIQMLSNAYSEELLAHDIYSKMVEKYPNLIELKNIINSELNHKEQVGRLLDTRNIVRPTGYWAYTGTYDVLIKMTNSSLTGAIEAGVMIEVGDIDHLLAEYKKIEDTDVRMVFENIGGGSFNHLRAFLKFANENKYSVKTDSTQYLKLDEVNSSGPLQSKMTDLLNANNLPTYGRNMPMGMWNGQGNNNMENWTDENIQMMQGDWQWQGMRGRGMNR